MIRPVVSPSHDEVLHVETSLGQLGQRQTDDEGLAPMAQEAEAGEARMLVGRRAEELAQPGRRGVLERRRYRARIVGLGANVSNNSASLKEVILNSRKLHANRLMIQATRALLRD